MDSIINEIIQIYFDKENANDKLVKISNIILNNNNLVKKFIKLLKKEIDPSQNIIYDRNVNINDINNEKNDINKSLKMINLLHNILYDTLSEISEIKLYGKDEMILKSTHDKIYHVVVCKTDEKNIIFNAFLMLIALESVANRHFYLCIDFEYMTSYETSENVIKNKIIKLGQFNYEHRYDNRSFIFITSPLSFNKEIFHNFVYYNLCNKRIKKILHGSDSLDIPNLYGIFLKKNPALIIKFTRSMYDTKLSCEYYKATILGTKDKTHCSIYDALLFFEVLDDKKMEDFKKIDASLPIPEDRTWFIDRLGEGQLKYALYDVLYLKYLHYNIIKMAYNKTPNIDAQQDSIITVYGKLIPEMTQLAYLERNQIIDIMEQCKREIDPVNNYMIKNTAKGVLKLIDIFKIVSKDIILTSPFYIDLDKMVMVNYFAAPFNIFFKKIVYTIVSQKFNVYTSKIDIWDTKLSNKYLFDFLKDNKYKHIEQLLRTYQEFIYNKILDYIKAK